MISYRPSTGRHPAHCVVNECSYFIACSGQDLHRLNDKEDMEEIRFDHAGMEWRVLFLKNNADDIIADMTLALDLRRVCPSKR